MTVLNSLIVDKPLLSCSSHLVRELESDRVSVVLFQVSESCVRYSFQELTTFLESAVREPVSCVYGQCLCKQVMVTEECV